MEPTDRAIALGVLALRFGRVNRATMHEDGITPESDTDHTVMLGLVACSVAADIGYDVSRVAELALVHDLIEVYAGDTNSFDMTAEVARGKMSRETAALTRIIVEFGEGSWIVRTILAYEQQAEPAARLVRYIDKATPKITYMLNHGDSVRAIGKTRADLVRAHREQLGRLSEEYPEFDNGPVQALLFALMRRSVRAWRDPE